MVGTKILIYFGAGVKYFCMAGCLHANENVVGCGDKKELFSIKLSLSLFWRRWHLPQLRSIEKRQYGKPWSNYIKDRLDLQFRSLTPRMGRTFFMVKGGKQGRLKYEGGARTKRRPYFLGNLIENTSEIIKTDGPKHDRGLKYNLHCKSANRWNLLKKLIELYMYLSIYMYGYYHATYLHFLNHP